MTRSWQREAGRGAPWELAAPAGHAPVDAWRLDSPDGFLRKFLLP